MIKWIKQRLRYFYVGLLPKITEDRAIKEVHEMIEDDLLEKKLINGNWEYVLTKNGRLVAEELFGKRKIK